MKIKKLRIETFRSFSDQEFELNRYTCFVGPNGAGKSTILCALNVFFKEQDSSATDTSKLCDEDFFARQTNKPLRITVTFDDLSDEAKSQLSDYVRHDELVVTAEAKFDPDSGIAQVRHFGQRLGMAEFRPVLRGNEGQCQCNRAQWYLWQASRDIHRPTCSAVQRRQGRYPPPIRVRTSRQTRADPK